VKIITSLGGGRSDSELKFSIGGWPKGALFFIPSKSALRPAGQPCYRYGYNGITANLNSIARDKARSIVSERVSGPGARGRVRRVDARL